MGKLLKFKFPHKQSEWLNEQPRKHPLPFKKKPLSLKELVLFYIVYVGVFIIITILYPITVIKNLFRRRKA